MPRGGLRQAHRVSDCELSSRRVLWAGPVADPSEYLSVETRACIWLVTSLANCPSIGCPREAATTTMPLAVSDGAHLPRERPPLSPWPATLAFTCRCITLGFLIEGLRSQRGNAAGRYAGRTRHGALLSFFPRSRFLCFSFLGSSSSCRCLSKPGREASPIEKKKSQKPPSVSPFFLTMVL